MKVSFDFAACNGHGDCGIEAPEVFDLSDDSDVGTLLEKSPDGVQPAQVERASAMCPVAAVA